MTGNNTKSTALQFIREFGFYKATAETLQEIIRKQGYSIIEYNNIYNDEHVSTLLSALNLERLAEQSKGFTYADRNHRLVFIHEDLAEEEKLLILAHEEGHIYCEHLSSTPIIGKDVIEEHEANEFAHYILKKNPVAYTRAVISKHRKTFLISALAVLVFIAGLLAVNYKRQEAQYYGNFYLTATGNKYHEENCIFVKDKTSVRRMTIEEFESGEYEPCGICLPHAENNS